jgi:hypothetical protein
MVAMTIVSWRHATADWETQPAAPAESKRAHLSEPSESSVDFPNGAGGQQIDLLSNAAGGGLDVVHLRFGVSEVRIHEHGDRRSIGPQLAQQLQLLWLELALERAYASDVAAGTIQIGDDAAPHRVGAADENDRYGRGCHLCRQRRRLAANRNDDRYLPMHEIGGERSQPVVLAFGGTIIGGEVSPLDQAGLV